jgi:uncharacterized protein YecT (DUF1311 family)
VSAYTEGVLTLTAQRFAIAMVLMLTLVALPGSAEAQTPDKQAALERWKTFYAQVVRLQKDAAAALNREMDREKADLCRNAATTRDAVECLGRENEAATVNYKAYLDALRSLLALSLGNDENRSPGPTGVPLTSKELVEEFDAVEAAWQKYRQAQCMAAFDLYKSGTAAAPQASSCELTLVRNHMRELEKIYYVRLHN